MIKALRLTDVVSAADRSTLAGLADMQGCWHSCDEKNAGVPTIEVSLEGAKVTTRVYGRVHGDLVDWGAVSTRALLSENPASPQVAGFVVRFPFGDTEAQLQINFKIGVAVAGIFVRGTDASGQPRALFWREFLARGEEGITESVRPLSGAYPESLSHRLLHGAAIDFEAAAIAGRWRNTNAKSRGIPEIVIESRGAAVALRMWGRAENGGLHPWGEVVAETYGTIEEDNQVSCCALATYEFDFMDCDVQIRQNKGVLAVTLFNRFKDGSDRFDYVTREIYYREALALPTLTPALSLGGRGGRSGAVKALRLRDREPARAAAGGPEDLLGSWVNTHSQPQGLSRLDLAHESSELVMRMWGPDGRELEAWRPETAFYSGISSPEIIAFSACCDLGKYKGLLQGNLNLGLLVLGAYKTFPRGGGYFSREFFARRQLAASTFDSSGPALFAGVEEPVVVNPESMVGTWRNTEPQSPGINEVTMEQREGHLIVEVFGRPDGELISWGKAEAGVYGTVDELGVKTFSVLASYDLGFMVSDLQIRLTGGVLAIADFSSFLDSSDRRDYMTREFYYRL